MIENDFLSTEQEIRLRGEVKDFVKTVDPELLRKMDRNEIEYPFEFLHETSFSERIRGKGDDVDR
jgi:hypothetical protein